MIKVYLEGVGASEIATFQDDKVYNLCVPVLEKYAKEQGLTLTESDESEEVLWARQCDVTGEGMNEGWCWGDGEFYTKYEKDVLAKCVKDKDSIVEMWKEANLDKILDAFTVREIDAIHDAVSTNKVTAEVLLKIAYGFDLFYWTEWELPYDAQYKEINGKIIEL